MRIKGRRSISERPKSVEKRDEYGHWEADTVHDGEKLYLTLVERKTRYAIVREVQNSAQLIKDTLSDIIENERLSLKIQPRKFKILSITFDNGSEFAFVPQLEKDFESLTTYFADPRHPEQRGSNEYFNGLLRLFFPKKHKLKLRNLSLKEAVELLNHKKRKIHNFRSAHSMLLASA